MSYKTLLSVDLESGVTPKQRDDFDAALARFKWAKIPNSTTTWRCSWSGIPTKQDILLTTKRQVASAAKEARIKTYHAVAHTGSDDPAVFKS